MGKKKSWKTLLYIDLATVGVGLLLVISDAYALGKLAGAAEDDPSRSEVDTGEASSSKTDSESGD